jgi:hypothetical protein
MAIVVVLVIAVLYFALSGGGATSDAQVQSLGDTTTPQAVIGALDGTGYELRYRKVPHFEEYDVIAGEARHGSSRVQFSAEIRRAGPFEEVEHQGETPPQPSIMRYGTEEEGEIVGNVRYKMQLQAPRFVTREFELESSKAEQKMVLRIESALTNLFAPRFQPGV